MKTILSNYENKISTADQLQNTGYNLSKNNSSRMFENALQ
jgi:hypothetical protein